MSFFEFPNTRTYDSDLGWLIRAVKKLSDEVANKTISYADPIDWSITSQYPVNTVVIENNVAYLSKQPVPVGIAITNTDYWQPIFDLTPIIDYLVGFRDQITAKYEELYVATASYEIGDWIFINDGGKPLLYIVSSPITAGDALVAGVNIVKTTVEGIFDPYLDRIANVRSYGAVPGTDSTAAFNKAIDDINAGYKDVLFIPAGNYYISDALNTIGRSGVRICGLGNGISIITAIDPLKTSSDALFTIKHGSAMYNIEVDHFDIMGAKDNSTQFTAFDCDNTHNLNIHDIYVRWCYCFANLGSDNSAGGIWTIFRDIIGSITRYFVNLAGGYAGVYMENCEINSERDFTSSTMIRCPVTLDTMYIANCIFQRAAYGMIFNAGSGVTIQDVYCDNTIFDGMDNNSVNINATGGLVLRLFFNNSWFTTVSGYGIVIGSGSSVGRISDIKITDCNFPVNYRSCILMQSDIIDHVAIIGNDLTNFNVDSGGIYAGIRIADSIKNFIIANNVIGNIPSNPATAQRAIQIGNNCSNFNITDNDVESNLDSTIVIGTIQASDAGSVFVKGNIGYNNPNTCAAFTVPASGTPFTHTDPRSATYYLRTGTLTNLNLNGYSLGAVVTSWRCNPGDTFTLTYTGSPTIAVQYD